MDDYYGVGDHDLDKAGGFLRSFLVGLPRLLLARRHALPRLHPLHEGGLGVANGTADPDVGRAIPAHARLGEPGEADLQTCARFFSGQ